MDTVVAMLIICWMPQKDATLKEVWRIEQKVSADICLQMTTLAAGGGPKAAITVSCSPANLESTP